MHKSCDSWSYVLCIKLECVANIGFPPFLAQNLCTLYYTIYKKIYTSLYNIMLGIKVLLFKKTYTNYLTQSFIGFINDQTSFI